jgi:hypothetical protein
MQGAQAGGGGTAQQQQHLQQLQLQGEQQHAPQQQEQQQPAQPATCAHLTRALHGSNNSELLTAAIRFLLPAHERSGARTVLGGLPDLKAFLEHRLPFLKAAFEDEDHRGARKLLQTWVGLAQQQQDDAL